MIKLKKPSDPVRSQSGFVLVTGADKMFYEVYNPATGGFEPFTPHPIPGESSPPARIGPIATLLADDRILVTGAFGNPTFGGYAEVINLERPQAREVYRIDPRFGHTATLLHNGRVLIAGGSFGVSPSGSPPMTRTTLLFRPGDGVIGEGEVMASPRSGHSALPLADGSVLIIGGHDGDAEIYDVDKNRFQVLRSDLSRVRSGSSTTLLPNGGTVLIIGGYTEDAVPLDRGVLLRPLP